MRGLLRKFHRVPPPNSKTVQESVDVDSQESSSGRRSKFRLSSATSSQIVHKVFVPVIKPECEFPVTPTASRKRDRLKNYLSRRRESKKKEQMPYMWPAILSTDQEEQRSTDDTDDGDDVYMVDYENDLDSDVDSLFGNDFVTPPVIIPEMYQRQDRQNGVIVAGARVLFTYAGYKRKQMMLRKLQSVFESDELIIPLGLHRENIVIGVY